MTNTKYHLAQVNIAKMKAELEDPLMTGFVAELDSINSLADSSKGFVWRYQTSDGHSSYLRPYEDNLILFNMSVWEDVESLKDYVYASRHLQLLRAKEKWFKKMRGEHLALWWIPAGTTPSVEDGLEKLRAIDKQGPSPEVFTFRKIYPAIS